MGMTARIGYSLGFLVLSLMFAAPCLALVPVIGRPVDATVSIPGTYSMTPTISNGAAGVTWSKLYGHDDLTVNSTTGAVSWTIPSGFPQEGYYVGVRACNADGCGDATWIVKVGGGSYRYVGSGQTYSTISAATAAAASGDTIVIKAGTYTGTNNQMRNLGTTRGQMPPSGSSGVYTTVMAEYPGAVTLDGQNTLSMIDGLGNYSPTSFTMTDGIGTYALNYIAFKGFIVKSSASATNGGCVIFNHVDHIKLTHILAYDSNAESSPIGAFRSGYILFENCASWGNGRAKLTVYLSEYCVMRRSFARFDYSTATDPDEDIMFYASNYTRGQNLLDIDSLSNNANMTYDGGAFVISVGGWGSNQTDNKISESIVLNRQGRFEEANSPSGSHTSPTYSNVVAYDLVAEANASQECTSNACNPITTSAGLTFSNVTFGKWSASEPVAYSAMINDWANVSSLTNSILFNFKDSSGSTVAYAMYGMNAVDNINVYQAYATNLIANPGTTATNVTTTNPQTNGLLYLPRVEPGSNLANAGIGATVMYMRGKSGTMFGDTGYDDLTSVPMWPFPMEDLIKTQMCAYNLNGVTGNRGYCLYSGKDGVHNTLTSYIWEYLGNQIPASIYSTKLSAPANLQYQVVSP